MLWNISRITINQNDAHEELDECTKINYNEKHRVNKLEFEKN